MLGLVSMGVIMILLCIGILLGMSSMSEYNELIKKENDLKLKEEYVNNLESKFKYYNN